MGLADVRILGGLLAAGQQQDDLVAVVQVVDAIARALVDPQLGDALSDGLDVARVACREAVDPDQHSRGRTLVPQLGQPSVECR